LDSKKELWGISPVHASHLCRLVAQLFVEHVYLAVLQAENAREDVTDRMASRTWPRDRLTRRSGLIENRRRSGARPDWSQRLPFRPPSVFCSFEEMTYDEVEVSQVRMTSMMDKSAPLNLVLSKRVVGSDVWSGLLVLGLLLCRTGVHALLGRTCSRSM
jgi:hypothetical protein